jgi:20S proteasome alpha/beta subunit
LTPKPPIVSRHKQKRPSVRRKAVTVCIAARCRTSDKHNKYCLVTVSDTKLSTGSYSGEMATLKLRRFSPHWLCLIAGTFAHHVPLVDRIGDAIGNEAVPYEKIQKVCTDAFIAENKRLVEESVLSPFGLTLEKFLKSRKDLGDSLYERTWAEVSRVKIDCQMLVCGFDPHHPHIFVVENPTMDRLGFVTNCDFPGFAAIGSGSYLADSTLFALQQNPARFIEETIYMTTAAKFAAESASDVGRETYIAMVTPDGEPKVEIDNSFTLVNELREVWDKEGKLKIPKNASKVISNHVTCASGITKSETQKSEPEP